MNRTVPINQSNIIIREARAEDGQFFEKLYIAARSDEFAHLGWDANQIELLLKMQFSAQTQGYRTQFPDMKNFLIEARGRAVGRMITTSEIRLIDIAVLPESRNLGIGSFVLNYLLKKADEENKDVVLQVLKNNVAAFQLYKRFGFQTIGEDDLYLTMRRRPLPVQ